METRTEAKLLWFIKYVPPACVVIVCALFSYLSYIDHRALLDSEIQQTTQQCLQNNRALIKHEVTRVLGRFQREKDALEDRLRQLSKMDTEYGVGLVRTVLVEHKGETRAQQENAAIAVLRQARLRAQNGYYIVVDTNGIGVLNEIVPNYRGLDLKPFSDGRGQYMVKTILDRLEIQEDMYLDWHWGKPGFGNTFKHKIGYFTHIRPLNWIVGSGSYVEDYLNEVQSKILNDITRIRFGRSGYVFVVDLDGVILSHIQPDLLGRKISYLNRQYQVGDTWQDAISLAQSGGGYLSMSSLFNPFTGNAATKTQYVQAFPDWGWIVGAGFYEDDVQSVLQPRLSTLRARGVEHVQRMMVVAGVVTATMLLISVAMTRYAERMFVASRVRLESLSNSDRLTGLFNRMKLDETLGEELRKFQHCGESLAVIMIGVDDFRRINDGYGHQVGDQVLKRISEILQDCRREDDVLGRWGREEFMMICPRTTAQDAENVAERCRNNIAEYVFGDVGNLTASFGVTEALPQDSVVNTVKRTDEALRTARTAGGNRVILDML